MPLIEHRKGYNPSLPFRFGHVSTIVPNLLRRQDRPGYKRERVELEDGDFIDLDYVDQGAENTILMLHGLEGSSEAVYVKGMARVFLERGWNFYVMNYRGCSGEPNRLLRAYHSGATEDVRSVIEWIRTQKEKESLHLIGVSLGGNLTLKYLGEEAENAVGFIKRAMAISTPIALFESIDGLERSENIAYQMRFLRRLNEKAKGKRAIMEEAGFDLSVIRKMRSLREFDEWYTAPVHGFDDAQDYYHKASSLYVLDKIAVPTLLVSAKDDSFLTPLCYPTEIARDHDLFYFEETLYGGHVGFVNGSLNGMNWIEGRCLQFFEEDE